MAKTKNEIIKDLERRARWRDEIIENLRAVEAEQRQTIDKQWLIIEELKKEKNKNLLWSEETLHLRGMVEILERIVFDKDGNFNLKPITKGQ